jgi:16S rRNA (adenine1518-N6/adenine1519-N6)-dimethyltransferase
MVSIRAKKNLGQHFLRDRAVAKRIAGTLTGAGYDTVLEIGPGTGVLTEFLLDRNFADFRVIEIDNESAYYLRERFPSLDVIRGDFLKTDLDSGFPERIAVTGNFPYNISSQILFRILEYRNRVVELTGMFQKEVAERVCALPGKKVYGIISVLVQAYYDAEYLFTVPEHVFSPPPKVKSGVIRLIRNKVESLGCDEPLFFTVVKAAFNQRRKTLRNSLKSAFLLASEDCGYFKMRPEQLSVGQFVELTRWVDANRILSE